MRPTPNPMWARALIEAGKTTVFLASLLLLGVFIYGVVHFQLGALIVLAMLWLVIGAVIVGHIRIAWEKRRHAAHQ